MSAPATVPAVLDALAAWAEDDKHFTTGTFARDRQGRTVSVTSKRACRWCVGGKVDQLTGMAWPLSEQVIDLLMRASDEMGYHSDVDCNDRGGLAAVRAMIARARERSRP